MNYQVLTTTLKDVLNKENVKKILDFINENKEVAKEFIDESGEIVLKGMDTVAGKIDKASEFIKKHTDIPCEMYKCEKLDIDTLKNIINESKTPETKFVALLNTGRNKEDILEVFLQHLNENKEAVNMDKVYCIRCEMISEELKKSFGGKELLVIS